MPITIDGSNGITQAGEFNSDSSFGFKNRIINGAMVIDQRNAGSAVTTDGAYPVDRFIAFEDTDGAYSAQRDTNAPAGFINSLKWTTTTADTSIASQYAGISQSIEGFNVADLNWGTANAKTVTLSFWVRSSLTGTFGGAFRNSANNRSYPFTYSISVADTWEFKTITVTGDTSGTWLTDNGTGLKIFFGLGVGSSFSGTAGAWAGSNFLSATGAVSVIGTLNATWYITGVQLEVGSTATSFDYRPYTTELQLCQRYYCKTYNISVVPGTVDSNGSVGGSGTGNLYRPIVNWSYPVQMRATPTITIYSPATGTSGKARDDNAGTDLDASAYRTGTSGTRWYPASTPASGNDIFAQIVASIEL
jgi:hypothetical protein